jgi:hypothetical protein
LPDPEIPVRASRADFPLQSIQDGEQAAPIESLS